MKRSVYLLTAVGEYCCQQSARLSSCSWCFRKSNTTLPSSAAVEHLFSAASQVLTARRCHLADEAMDKVMLLQLRSLFKAGNDFMGW